MPQPDIIETVNMLGATRARPSDLALVMIECPRDKRQEMYRALAGLPCRVILIEEPATK